VDTLNKRIVQADSALSTLREALCLESPSALERDGTIQRFEYTYEIFWKVCQRFLDVVEGIRCASPKSCLREIGANIPLAEPETVLLMKATDDRNLTSYTYREKLAREIHERLPAYVELMGKVLGEIAVRIQKQGNGRPAG